MSERYCQYMRHWEADGLFLVATAPIYSGEEQPCGRVARFRCGSPGWWFCAEHYDIWARFHGERA